METKQFELGNIKIGGAQFGSLSEADRRRFLQAQVHGERVDDILVTVPMVHKLITVTLQDERQISGECLGMDRMGTCAGMPAGFVSIEVSNMFGGELIKRTHHVPTGIIAEPIAVQSVQ